ncbi:MAG: sugar ABC transporter permease [Spirochaetaceae bacterium]|nr:sugar ABC transporter permease [Spirochaetaceae bacterium]
MPKADKKLKRRSVEYSKWGYFFIAPFFIIYVIFSLIPLLSTFYYSFFECYRSGLKTIGPNFVGLQNYITVFSETDKLPKYAGNTMLLWLCNFIPQITVSLLLAIWFTSTQLNLKAQGFFKSVIYMPNLIMASAFAMLFFTLFSDDGPINIIIRQAGGEPIRFLISVTWVRILISVMNFLMWFGNTTIMLMAGIMSIDVCMFEAARIDGASSTQTFFKITMPLLMPIFIYTFITSMIGGIQLFDVPQILSNGTGNPNRTSMTIIMYLNKHLFSQNLGMGGAISTLVFIATAILGMFVYNTTMERYRNGPKKRA